jgi:hypothetical protein
MAGLLDFLNSDEARLGLGLLSAAGPSMQPMGLGQRLTQGLQYVKDQQENDLKRKLMESQTKAADFGVQKGGIEIDELKRKQADQEAQRKILSQFYGGQGLPMGATNLVNQSLPQSMQMGAQPAIGNQPGKADQFTAYRTLGDRMAAGGQPEAAQQWYTLAEKFRPEFSTTPQQMMVNGKLMNVLVGKDGTLKTLEDFGVKPEMVSEDLGGVKKWIDKNTVKVGEELRKTMTPGEIASQAMSERHFQVSQANAGNQFDPERGMIVNTRSGIATPVMNGGVPLGPKDKNMTDAQAKANLFGTRMLESNRILNSLDGKYSPAAVNAKMSAGDLPLVGGAAGAVGNLMLTDAGQSAEQAQRDFVNAVLRRESGAVISPSEFANAQKQYFPQPNDPPALRQQKRRNRELAISGLQMEVPGGFKVAPTLTNPGNTGGASGVFDMNAIDAELARRRGGK